MARRSSNDVVSARYAAIGWGPIKVGPLPIQENQSDVTSQRPATGPGDRAWQGKQLQQLELQIYSGYDFIQGIPYYNRQLAVPHGQLDSFYGQTVGPGANVLGANGVVYDAPTNPSIVSRLRAAVLSVYGGQVKSNGS
jgi:hypothetical protein